MWLRVVNVMYGSNGTRWGRLCWANNRRSKQLDRTLVCLFRLFFCIFPFCANSTKACIVSAHLAWSFNTSYFRKVQCLLGRRTTPLQAIWRKTGIIFLRDKLFSQTRAPSAPPRSDCKGKSTIVPISVWANSQNIFNLALHISLLFLSLLLFLLVPLYSSVWNPPRGSTTVCALRRRSVLTRKGMGVVMTKKWHYCI